MYRNLNYQPQLVFSPLGVISLMAIPCLAAAWRMTQRLRRMLVLHGAGRMESGLDELVFHGGLEYHRWNFCHDWKYL